MSEELNFARFLVRLKIHSNQWNIDTLLFILELKLNGKQYLYLQKL